MNLTAAWIGSSEAPVRSGTAGLEPGAPPMLRRIKGPFLQIISIVTKLRRSVVTRVWTLFTKQAKVVKPLLKLNTHTQFYDEAGLQCSSFAPCFLPSWLRWKTFNLVTMLLCYFVSLLPCFLVTMLPRYLFCSLHLTFLAQVKNS